MANMRQQSKGREKERDILGDTPSQFWLLSRRNFGYFPAAILVTFPPQFWLLSRRVVDIPPCGSFPDPFLANVPPLGVWVLVEGRGSRVQSRGSRVICRGSRVTYRGFLKMKIKS